MEDTICRAGWATVERARYFPKAEAAAVKRHMLLAYAWYGGAGSSGYELDHLVPLSLGGSPDDQRNLWVEAGGAPNAKDRVEAWARAQVCSGMLSLASAQAVMARNWTELDAGDSTASASIFGGGIDE